MDEFFGVGNFGGLHFGDFFGENTVSFVTVS